MAPTMCLRVTPSPDEPSTACLPVKTWWPFFLAAAVTGALVVLYLAGWYSAAWVLAFLLIGFPVIYAVLAIAWAELGKRKGPRVDDPERRQDKPPLV